MAWFTSVAPGDPLPTGSPRLLSGVLATLWAFAAIPVHAQEQLQHRGAQLEITPKRVSLGPDQREAHVALNLPWGAGDFQVNFIDRIMLPDGRIVAVDESAGEPLAAAVLPNLRSAQPFVAVTPSGVALRGGGPAADVRVTLAGKPPPPGEYRTHLTFTAAEPPAPPEGAPATMNWAHAIPVLIRVGRVDARAEIENARVETLTIDQGKGPSRQRVLIFDLVRRGGNSLYGDLTMHAPGGATAPIATGLAVYTEIERRRVVHPLGAATGMVEVRFTDRDTRPGHVTAQAWVSLSPTRAEAQVQARAPEARAFAGAE